MKLRLSIAVLAALAVGCSDQGPGGIPQIRVDPQGSQFQLVTTGTGPSATIPYTITNTGGQPVFVSDCSTVADRLVNGQWVPDESSTMICALANSSLTTLRPGERVDALKVVGQAGTWRLRTTFSADLGSLEAVGTGTSPSFVVQ